MSNSSIALVDLIDDSDKVVCIDIDDVAPGTAIPRYCTKLRTKRANPNPRTATSRITIDGTSSESERVDCKKSKTETASPEKKTVNRFAKFAHGGAVQVAVTTTGPTFLSKKSIKTSACVPAAKAKDVAKQKWIPIRDLQEAERQQLTEKWHSLLRESSLEDRRFEMMASALLHARCQEPVVRSALTKLREELGSINVHVVASHCPDDLVKSLKSLQYHNSKAKYMVQAAQQIQIKFQGEVPEQVEELQQLPGIGPIFADLLAYVNTRKMHGQMPNLSLL